MIFQKFVEFRGNDIYQLHDEELRTPGRFINVNDITAKSSLDFHGITTCDNMIVCYGDIKIVTFTYTYDEDTDIQVIFEFKDYVINKNKRIAVSLCDFVKPGWVGLLIQNRIMVKPDKENEFRNWVFATYANYTQNYEYFAQKPFKGEN